MTKVEVFAPAKINLALHITGQREDGYHLLDSIVAFVSVGDRLVVENNGSGEVSARGAEASGLPLGPDNLIAKQNAAIADRVGLLTCILHKELPVSSGIGGGSADAAALYRAAVALVDDAASAAFLTDEATISNQWRIGADIPMCIKSLPARVTGIGERIDPIPALPEMPIVLVNPRVPVPTGAVFASLSEKNNPGVAGPLPQGAQASQWIEWLAEQRNDLQPPAIAQVPLISQAIDALHAAPHCLFARMSGSGATCFGLFETDSVAEVAAAQIARLHPDWWVRSGRLDGHRRVAPQVIRSTT